MEEVVKEMVEMMVDLGEADKEEGENSVKSTQHYRSRKHCVPFSGTLWLKK